VFKEERETIVRKAQTYVGRPYGVGQLIFHFLDWLLLGAYVFRRLGSDKYPICSWVVAHAYAVVGKYFGQPPGAADPDHIWDFVVAKPDKYQWFGHSLRLGASHKGVSNGDKKDGCR